MGATDNQIQALRDELLGLEAAPYLSQLGSTEEALKARLGIAVVQAKARVGRELQITLDTAIIKCNPDAGAVFDVEEEAYDYHTADYQHFGWVKLRRKPVQSIQRVRLMLGPTMTIFSYPSDWVRIKKRQAQLQVVPTPGQAFQNLMMANGLYYLPYLSAAPIFDEYPQLIAVDYTAGLGPALESEEYADLALQISRLAAREVLMRLSNTVNPGISSQSISEDGASESISYARGVQKVLFGGQIDQIESDWTAFKAAYVAQNTGINFTVV